MQTIQINFNTTIGILTLESIKHQIYKISKPQSKKNLTISSVKDKFLLEAINQISNFLTGNRKRLDLPFQNPGIGIFQKIYEIVMQIPYGSTISYGSVAQKAGIVRGARIVGNAMAKNPLPLLIPCHRVIRSDGSYGHYSLGSDIIKEYLLKMEFNLHAKENQ